MTKPLPCPALVCPVCGSPMTLRAHSTYRYPNGAPRQLYQCMNALFCTATHGAHPDGSPVGIPGDHATMMARSEAHDALDRLRAARGWGVTHGYRWLRRITGLTRTEAHIGRFDVARCRAVIAAVADELE